jgi:hypothetical protein
MRAFTFVVLSLAAYRASRALSLDSITAPMRDRLDFWSQGRGGWRQKVAELISCGWCSGFWLSGVTYAVYVTVTGRWEDEPVLVHLIFWWAIAGAQSLLIAIDAFLLREAPPS